MYKVKVVPYWDLSVTILHAKLNHSYDYITKSDCYVVLKLPTASAHTYQTQVVPNSDSPEWNETFPFRIHSHVKHVLEMKVYDSDTTTQDDVCFGILFDISQLKLGQKETRMFITDTEDKLWVKFDLEESPRISGYCLSNGVLMATPDIVLEANSNQSGEGPETELPAQGDDTIQPISQSALSLSPPNAEQERQESAREDSVDSDQKTEEWPKHELAMRLDFDIPSAEKHFLEKRKVVVGRALHKLLELSSPPDTDEVPLVGVVCSGGGARAMTGTFGSLKALQTLGILDAVSYITGVSGSTWAMSTLYDKPDWSQDDLGVITEPMKEEMLGRFQGIFSNDQHYYYRQEMDQREADGLQVSLIDLWGLVIEHLIYGKKWESTLSDQERAVSEGQNPLPIYTAVNMKTSLKGRIAEAEWCEFTPYEVGLLKYGAFVPTKDFGSQYFLGQQINNLPESRLSFLLGIWSSAFSLSFTQLWSFVTGRKPSWTTQVGEDITHIETDSKPSTLDTLLIKPTLTSATMITKFFSNRPITSQVFNFMHGLSLHWNYNKKSNFTDNKDLHPDAFPNQLTPADPNLTLVDSGLDCNIGFPPVLRHHRHMDLILSLNYSWDSDQFQVLKKTQKYCTDHGLPFPHIDFSHVEKEPLREVYVFEDEKNPKAPIVVHFPLVNLTFREFKAPGVRREGEDELQQGEVDVSTKNSPYRTRNLAFQPEDFQKLMDLTHYNILNNRDTLLSALRRALQRERVHEDEDIRMRYCCP